VAIEWEPIAAKLGYADETAMWQDLYVTRRLSVSKLTEMFDVSRNTIRYALDRAGVTIRPSGGPNNMKIEITAEVIEAVRLHGIRETAKALGVTYSTLYKRLYRVGQTPAERLSAEKRLVKQEARKLTPEQLEEALAEDDDDFTDDVL
jgi:transposase